MKTFSKKVYWVNQNVTEFWIHDNLHGWREVGELEDYDEWYNINASQGHFENRKYGCLTY